MVIKKLLVWWAVLLVLLAGATSVAQFGGGCAGAGPVNPGSQPLYPATQGTQPPAAANNTGAAKPAGVLPPAAQRDK